jgi:hypothetical protein
MGEMIAVIKRDAYPDELVRGECIYYVRHEDKNDREKITSYGLIICCPRCGKTSTGVHTYDPDTKTLHPSIVCNSINDNGIKCDYHGWLKNGIFTEV